MGGRFEKLAKFLRAFPMLLAVLGKLVQGVENVSQSSAVQMPGCNPAMLSLSVVDPCSLFLFIDYGQSVPDD